MRYIIKNGTICLAGEQIKTDLLIEGEQVLCLGKSTYTGSETVIDAAGKYICPGGIDPHTHMDLQQSPRYRACDDFYTGGVAAACGGTTTIIDHMAFGSKGCPLQEPFDTYRRLAERCPIDYSFHGVIQDVDAARLAEMAQLIEAGKPSFKAYTTYGYPVFTAELLELCRVMKEHAGLLTVHAENDAITKLLRASLTKAELQPIGQAMTRPNAAEAEAVEMVLCAAKVSGDAPVYIVHLSAHESLAQVRLARGGQQKNIYVETCPQYLFLTEEKFVMGGAEEGIKYILAPPLRKQQDNQALWQGLQDGQIQVVATDHCPFTIAEKEANVDDFRNCPGGIPGVEERISLLFSEGVLQGRLSLERFVQVTSANAAKIFGLYGRKGALLPGFDADIVIINPAQRRTFHAVDLKSACGYSAYENMTMNCTIDQVFLRGQIIAQQGNFLGQKGAGQYLLRKRTVAYDEIVE